MNKIIFDKDVQMSSEDVLTINSEITIDDICKVCVKSVLKNGNPINFIVVDEHGE